MCYRPQQNNLCLCKHLPKPGCWDMPPWAPGPFRGAAARVQGWESVCWGVLRIPLLENKKYWVRSFKVSTMQSFKISKFISFKCSNFQNIDSKVSRCMRHTFPFSKFPSLIVLKMLFEKMCCVCSLIIWSVLVSPKMNKNWRVKKSRNHRNEGFEGSHTSKSRGDKFKLKQNHITKLLSTSFPSIYHTNGSTNCSKRFVSGFSGFSIGNRFFKGD